MNSNRAQLTQKRFYLAKFLTEAASVVDGQLITVKLKYAQHLQHALLHALIDAHFLQSHNHQPNSLAAVLKLKNEDQLVNSRVKNVYSSFRLDY